MSVWFCRFFSSSLSKFAQTSCIFQACIRTWRETRALAAAPAEKPCALAAALRALDLRVCLHTTLFPRRRRYRRYLRFSDPLRQPLQRHPRRRRYSRSVRPARSSSLARTAALNAAASVIHGTCLPPIMLNGSSPLASRYTSTGRGSS